MTTQDQIDPDLELDAEAGLNSGLNAEPEADLAPLDAVIAERDEWKDRALRAVAEAENVKRRSETQQNDARAYAIQRFARDLLGVADSLERALQTAPKEAEGPSASLVSGLELIQKSFTQALESNNVKRVDPQAGETFDPNLHQAMMEQPSETVQGGQVIQTLQAGYALFGRVLRPAMVVVAAKGSGAAAGNAAYAAAPASGGGNFDGQA